MSPMIMESTADVDEFFNALKSLDFGRVVQIDGGWMFEYKPHPTTHTDGDRRVFVELYVTEYEIGYEKRIDGQQRQHQHPNKNYTDFPLEKFDITGDEDIEYRYQIREEGATRFEFEIVIDGESYYNFFHEEEQLTF